MPLLDKRKVQQDTCIRLENRYQGEISKSGAIRCALLPCSKLTVDMRNGMIQP